MGPGPAATATARLLDSAASEGTPVDHVMVVGICGGLDPGIDVGTVLAPERVVDHTTGDTYRPAPTTGGDRTGALVTTECVHVDDGLSRRLLADGALGVDMESAAVARVCEERRRPWSVHRCISDRWVDGLLDPRVVALTANALQGDREKFLGLGFDGYLSKPLSPESLQNVLAGATPHANGESARTDGQNGKATS